MLNSSLQKPRHYIRFWIQRSINAGSLSADTEEQRLRKAVLILPFCRQRSPGGFAAYGAVIIWSILAPIGALMFAGTTRAPHWFIAYVLLVAISGPLTEPPLPRVVFEALNRFQKGSILEDDMTLVIIKIEKKGMRAQ